MNGRPKRDGNGKDPRGHGHDATVFSGVFMAACEPTSPAPVVAVAVPFQSTVQLPFPEKGASVTDIWASHPGNARRTKFLTQRRRGRRATESVSAHDKVMKSMGHAPTAVSASPRHRVKKMPGHSLEFVNILI